MQDLPTSLSLTSLNLSKSMNMRARLRPCFSEVLRSAVRSSFLGRRDNSKTCCGAMTGLEPNASGQLDVLPDSLSAFHNKTHFFVS